jgi:predicted alpha/beta superfamily hydrolase
VDLLSLASVKQLVTTILFLALLACSSPPSTGEFEPGVHVIDSFYMPQFGYTRHIWVYLPPDYAMVEKKYPVLYMQDGQNLFEDSASFVGEWRVDETLDSLHKLGDYGCIVVGVENAGQRRTAEYMPNPHPKYGGGEGEKYVEFLTSTLKPYIDSVYRTKPEAEFTAIGGSSLGGLISYYGAMNHPDVFGKAMVMSPSFWIDSNYVNWRTKLDSPKCYFVAGEYEDEGDVKAKIRSLKAIWFALGYKGLIDIYPEDGEHNEWFWAREFGPAYQWLFEDVTHEMN